MTKKRAVRTLTPNGEEIRKLRLAQGKTQEEFVSQGGITQRTLQRAEQGKPVGSQHLTAIAKRLQVPAEQIVKDAIDKRQAEEKDVVIIRLTPVKGRQLVELLLTSFLQVEYSFRVDPSSETAELIAEVIETCDVCLGVEPVEQIRTIGKLNDKLEVLASREVGVFASEVYTWETELQKRDVWKPRVKGRLMVAFGPVNEPFMSKRFHSNNTKKSVYERCAKNNLDKGIFPDALEDIDDIFVDEFHAFYRAYYDAQRATTPNPKVIALVAQE